MSLSSVGSLQPASYNYPSEFNYTPPFSVFKAGTSISHNLTTEKFRADFKITGLTYHVDVVNGNDTNDGLSQGTALKTLNAAFLKVGVKEVIVYEGVYDRITHGFTSPSQRIQGDISVTGVGKVIMGGAILEPKTWVVNATHSNVLETDVPGMLISFMASNTAEDVEGVPVQYPSVVNLATCAATTNSFYFDDAGDKLYVNLTGATISNIQDLVSFVNNGNTIPSNVDAHLYFENINFFGWVNVENQDSTTNLKAYFLNCNSYFAKDGGASFEGRGVSEIGFLNCRGMYSLFDGFSYTEFNGITTKGFEVDCVSKYIGATSPGASSNQNSTCHIGTQLLRVKGSYTHAQTQNITDVNIGTYSVNLGCILNTNWNPGISSLDSVANLRCFDAIMHVDSVVITGSEFAHKLSVRNTVINLIDTPKIDFLEETGGVINEI